MSICLIHQIGSPGLAGNGVEQRTGMGAPRRRCVSHLFTHRGQGIALGSWGTVPRTWQEIWTQISVSLSMSLGADVPMGPGTCGSRTHLPCCSPLWMVLVVVILRVPKNPKNGGSMPNPCLDKPVLAQGAGGYPAPGLASGSKMGLKLHSQLHIGHPHPRHGHSNHDCIFPWSTLVYFPRGNCI